MIFAPYFRIGLRYLAGVLVAKGAIDVTLADHIVNDPALVSSLAAGAEAILGLIAAVATEAWYRAARRSGWST